MQTTFPLSGLDVVKLVLLPNPIEKFTAAGSTLRIKLNIESIKKIISSRENFYFGVAFTAITLTAAAIWPVNMAVKILSLYGFYVAASHGKVLYCAIREILSIQKKVV